MTEGGLHGESRLRFRAKALRSKGAKKRRGDIFVIMSVIEEYRSLLDYQNEIY